ncbi:MAG TPA: hypothetical protein VEJ63_12910 [Planctomycetota bacterium]|nr:hypothetical protein [Planctomycetota bacterium]
MSDAVRGGLNPIATVPPPEPGFTLSIARFVILALMAGLLFLRQDFAHRNLGEIPRLWGGAPWPSLQFLYVTETALLLLLPIALRELWRLKKLHRGVTPIGTEPFQSGLGWPLYLALAFAGWGMLHALFSFVASQPRDTYLIARQSAMAGYAMFFVYAVLFFHRERRFVETAAALAFMTAILTAAVDFIAQYAGDPATPGPSRWIAFFNTKPYGQETLPIAILASALIIVYSGTWFWRVVFLAVLAFVGWRQGIRFQSVVPISIAGAVLAYLVLGFVSLATSHEHTVKRAVMIIGLFAICGVGYAQVRQIMKKDTPQGHDVVTGTPVETDRNEVSAWSPTVYTDLLRRYESAQVPADPSQYVFSTRQAGLAITDPEVYRLNTVYEAAPDNSVRNNIWRFLVWQQMGRDWWSGRPLIGAGVGKPWFYPALYHTQFHYGEDRLGLDPHNSFLNLLYRFGVVGFALLLALIGSVLHTAWRALKRTGSGDVLLEGLLLYFFYTVFFAMFTVALEGSPYAMPFWLSLGLVYVRARQVLHAVEG